MSDVLKVKQNNQPLDALQYLGTKESGDSLIDWVSEVGTPGWKVTQTRSDERTTFLLEIDTQACRVSVHPLDWVVYHGDGVFKSYPPHEFGYIFKTVEEEN